MEEHQIKRIMLIPYCHCDYAWTNTRQWHVLRYLKCFDTLVSVLEQYPQYTFVLDNVLHSLQPLRQYRPNCFARIQEFVRAGRIEIVDGGAALVRPSNCGDETFVRNIVAAKKTFAECFDVEPQVFFNADTGIGHSQLPQLLRLTGHMAYRVYRPDGAMNATGVPATFVWKGQDGSRVIVSRGKYHGFADAAYLEQNSYEERRAGFVREELMPALRKRSSEEDVCLMIGGDDTQPLHAVNDRQIPVMDFIQQWNEQEAIPMQFSTLHAFFEDVSQQELPVWQGVIDACELSYNMPLRSDLSMHRFRYTLERKLVTLEKLSVLGQHLGFAYEQDIVEQAWWQLLEISGHAHEMLLDEDYRDKLEIAVALERMIREKTKNLAETIAASVQKLSDNQYAVFNLHPIAMTRCVKLHITSPVHLKPFYLVSSKGEKLAHQVIRPYFGDKMYCNAIMNEADVLVHMTLPAFGYETVAVAWCDDTHCAAEENYATYAAPQPMIQNGQTPVDALKACCGFDAFGVRDIFGQLRFYRTESTGDWMTNFEPQQTRVFAAEQIETLWQGQLGRQIRVSGHLGEEQASVLYTFYHGEPCFDMEISIDSCGEEGFYTMAFQCDLQADILAGIPFGTEARDPDHEAYCEDLETPDEPYLVFERNDRGQYYARHFTTYCVNGHRFGLLQGDGSIYYRKKLNENVLEVVLKKSLDVRQCQVSWTQKLHPSTDGRGVHTFHLQGVCADGMSLTELHQMALEKEQLPVTARCYGVPTATHPGRYSLFTLKQTPVSAVFSMAGSTYIRTYEVEGTGCTLPLTGRKHDLLLRQLPEQETACQISLRPYEIATIEAVMPFENDSSENLRAVQNDIERLGVNEL